MKKIFIKFQKEKKKEVFEKEVKSCFVIKGSVVCDIRDIISKRKSVSVAHRIRKIIIPRVRLK